MSPGHGNVPLLPRSPHARADPVQTGEIGSPGGGAAIDSGYGLSPELSGGEYGEPMGPRGALHTPSVPWADRPPLVGWSAGGATTTAAALTAAADAAAARGEAPFTTASAVGSGTGTAADTAIGTAAPLLAPAPGPDGGAGTSAAASAADAASAAAAAAAASLEAIASAADRARSAAGSASLLQLEELDTLLQQHQQQLRARVDALRQETQQQHDAWYDDIQSILPSPPRTSAGGKWAAAVNPEMHR